MKHDFYTDEDGNIDNWRLEYDYHNGPSCRRCHQSWCRHCDPQVWDEECPSGQLELL